MNEGETKYCSIQHKFYTCMHIGILALSRILFTVLNQIKYFSYDHMTL